MCTFFIKYTGPSSESELIKECACVTSVWVKSYKQPIACILQWTVWIQQDA